MTRNATQAPGDQSVQADLWRFASRMLSQCGASMEWDRSREGAVARLPPRVASLLGVNETVSLAQCQEPNVLCINLASEFLDQSEVVLKSMVPRAGMFRVAEGLGKGPDVKKAIEQTFTWHDAKVRVRGIIPRCVEYHSWAFFVSLKSEDVWESQLSVTLNAATKTAVDLPDFLRLPDLEPSHQPGIHQPADTFHEAVKFVQSKLLETGSSFLARTESRLHRDRKRLRDYYGALLEDTAVSSKRIASAPSEELSTRKRAVNLELQRKLAELDERYQIEAVIEPMTLVSLHINVLQVELSVLRNRARRSHHVYWNPLIQHLEPLCCSNCGRGTFAAAFTDDLDVVCAGCQSRESTPPGGR